MTITKEIKIDTGEFKDIYLIEELSDRVRTTGCLLTEEGQAKLQPYIVDLQKQLDEIYIFMQDSTTYIRLYANKHSV